MRLYPHKIPALIRAANNADADHATAAAVAIETGNVAEGLWHGAVAAAIAAVEKAREQAMKAPLQTTVRRVKGREVSYTETRSDKVRMAALGAPLAGIEKYLAEVSATIPDASERIYAHDAKLIAAEKVRIAAADARDNEHYDPHWDVALLSRVD